MNWIAHRDSRSLFERAWRHGIASGVIDPEQQASMLKEGARAIRKIADILGTQNLRADLERALRSMLGLVNLHLMTMSDGDVTIAARSLAARGLLFHTRGASQAIKAILAEGEGVDPERLDPEQKHRFEVEVVTQWATWPYEDFLARQEEAECARERREAAAALAALLSGPAPDPFLHEPDRIIASALLVLLFTKDKAWPRTVRQFETVLQAVRSTPAKLGKLPRSIPAEHAEVIAEVWHERSPQLHKVILDTSFDLHVLSAGDPSINPLHELLALPDDALSAAHEHEALTTSHWETLTRGRSDEANLVATMLIHVLSLTVTVPFTLKAAEQLLRSIRAARPDDDDFLRWIEANAPHALQSDLAELWEEFWDDLDGSLHEDASVEDYRAFARNWLPVRVTAARRAS